MKKREEGSMLTRDQVLLYREIKEENKISEGVACYIKKENVKVIRKCIAINDNLEDRISIQEKL